LVSADLLEERPLRFDVRHVLLALIFPAAFFQPALFVPNVFQTVMAMLVPGPLRFW
jgi:hypothetical protein